MRKEGCEQRLSREGQGEGGERGADEIQEEEASETLRDGMGITSRHHRIPPLATSEGRRKWRMVVFVEDGGGFCC